MQLVEGKLSGFWHWMELCGDVFLMDNHNQRSNSKVRYVLVIILCMWRSEVNLQESFSTIMCIPVISFRSLVPLPTEPVHQPQQNLLIMIAPEKVLQTVGLDSTVRLKEEAIWRWSARFQTWHGFKNRYRSGKSLQSRFVWFPPLLTPKQSFFSV